MSPLQQSFFARDTVTVAEELVGCVLQVVGDDGGEVAGRIVEVEAYGGEDDPASHAANGRTPRSEIMFGPPGFAYVYIIYGMHHCLNFVTETEGTPGAVLIRGMEPVTGRELMAARRGLDPETAGDRDLCSGPGRLCQALGIDRQWNGLPLFLDLAESAPSGAGQIRIFHGEGPPGGPAATPRIGIRQATDRLHRFIDSDSGCLSG
ncbi:MAG: DNA-3-methyladenine glycosylase [Candidatus Krumholzibacteria bacterium]|nr:DNA-3-methyladenine glycosylase [Candidatus Krumholzibacteria bacterium]